MSQELIKRLRDELQGLYKETAQESETIEQVLADADIHIGDRENGPTFKQYRNQAFLALLSSPETGDFRHFMKQAEECARLMMK